MQEIMPIAINKITSVDLQRAVDNFAKTHQPKTVKERYALVIRCISNYLPDKKFKVNLPEKKKIEVEIPTEKEVLALLECAKGTVLEVPLYLLAFCGMRPSEACALTVDDIDFKRRTAYIHSDFVRGENNKKIVQDRTKTLGSTREIKLFTPVFDVIKNFEGKKGRLTDLSPDAIRKRVHTLCKQNNLKYYKPYTLRHYFVSVMLLMNIPKKYIADYLGHSEQMIDLIYGHVMRDKKHELFDAVELFFDQMHHKMQHKKSQSQE